MLSLTCNNTTVVFNSDLMTAQIHNSKAEKKYLTMILLNPSFCQTSMKTLTIFRGTYNTYKNSAFKCHRWRISLQN